MSSQGFTIIVPPVDKSTAYAEANGVPAGRATHVEVAVHVRPQREMVTSALQQFQDLLLSLFEAQESLRTEGRDEQPTNELFARLADNDSAVQITSAVLEKLQRSMKYLINHQVLKDIPTDHLRQLQQLCEASVERAQVTNLSHDSDSNEDEDAPSWQSRISKVEHGILSATTILWTVLADVHDPNLFPEESFGWISTTLNNTFENFLIPIIESRPDGKDQSLFEAVNDVRDQAKSLLESAQKLLDTLSEVCVKTTGGESAAKAVEYLATKLIFVENATSEKASALGIQAFERARKSAMGAIAKIFARYTEERSHIRGAILQSLSKLPSTSRSARQYKTSEGKNIQLITALMMQLVQTTTLTSSNRHQRSKVSDEDAADDGDEDKADIASNTLAARLSNADNLDQTSIDALDARSKTRFNDGVRSASEIVNELVNRASVTSKSSEDNYRNLFDLFVEDLLNVVSLPDWPAAELFLRLTAQQLIAIANSTRHGASAKNMALENLGNMGSTISRIHMSLGELMEKASQDENEPTSQLLLDMSGGHADGNVRIQDLTTLQGPFRIVYQAMQHDGSENLRAKSSRAFFLTNWAVLLCRNASPDHDTSMGENEAQLDSLHSQTVDVLLAQLESDDPHLIDQGSVSSTQCKLAYSMILASSGFCRRLADIVRTISASLGSDQAQVRSRSVKTLLAILETDDRLLDREAAFINDVFAAASDDSAMVRDSAITLIAKFIVPRPALQQQAVKCLLDCTLDTKIGVQKRSMNQLKDIYIRDDRLLLRAAIAASFLRRLDDPEETVSDLSQKLLSEIWIAPPSPAALSAGAQQAKTHIRSLAATMLSTLAQASEELEPSLDRFIGKILKTDAKNTGAILQLFTNIVSDLFETVLTGDDDISSDHKNTCLILLQLFARHLPQTVTADQLNALKPYLGSLSTPEDVNAFKPVVAIFRLVLPYLSSTQRPLLQSVQDALMKSVSVLVRRAEIDEVTSCLWAIDEVLANSERLVRLAASVLKPLMETRTPLASEMATAEGQELTQLSSLLEKKKRYVRLIGSIGKEWRLEQHAVSIRQKLPSLQGNSIAASIASAVVRVTGPEYTSELRAVALESLGSICQGAPELFKNDRIVRAFRDVFQASETPENDKLQKIVLQAFAGMMGSREERKDTQNQQDSDADEPVIEKMGGDATTQEHDAAASQIAQRFWDDIVQAALGKDMEKALTATRVVASINRQGLVHPKQCVGPLIALETCSNRSISNIAYESHKMMHQQHESTYERQYGDALRTTFKYVQDQGQGDSSGVARPSNVARLSRCFEVVNMSTSKHVKKFLGILVAATSLETGKISVSGGIPEHLLFSRFVAHNLAFFDYTRLDELLHTILQIEMQFTKLGADLAHSIGGPLQQTINGMEQGDYNSDAMPMAGEIQPATATVTDVDMDPTRLKQLATSATILTIMWETRTFLKRQYDIRQDVRVVISQAKQAKALDKAPQKLYAVTGDQYWTITTSIMSTFTSKEAMLDRCRSFVDLINVDSEVRVAADEDDLGLAERYSNSVDVDDEAARAMSAPIGSGKGRKRKYNASLPGSAQTTPSKKRGRPSLKHNPDGVR